MGDKQIKRFLDEIRDEFLKCELCNNLFDDDKHIPVHYPCSHSACKACVESRFLISSRNETLVICTVCKNSFFLSNRDISVFPHNYTLIDLQTFISSKKICSHCSNQMSTTFCTDCDLNLCRHCNEEIHIDKNLNHNVKFEQEKSKPAVDACHVCENQSDIYCPTCKIFFCYPCGDVQHNDESVGTHDVHKVNQYNIELLPPEEELNIFMKLQKTFCNSIDVVLESYNLLILKVQIMLEYILSFVTMKKLVLTISVITLFLGMFLNSFPAYTVLPLGTVERLNLTCQRSYETELESYEGGTSTVKQHSSLCKVNVHHRELRNKPKIYFAIDVNVHINRRPRTTTGQESAIIKLQLFYQTHISKKRRRGYWSIFRCKRVRGDPALCLGKENNDGKRILRYEQKVISAVTVGRNKTVPFFFIIDNNKHTMEIIAIPVGWKDEVSLHNYDKTQNLGVYILLGDEESAERNSANIRSGPNLKVGDIQTTTVSAYSLSIVYLMMYPVRCLLYSLQSDLLDMLETVKGHLHGFYSMFR